jgi:hypothetical protein
MTTHKILDYNTNVCVSARSRGIGRIFDSGLYRYRDWDAKRGALKPGEDFSAHWGVIRFPDSTWAHKTVLTVYFSRWRGSYKLHFVASLFAYIQKSKSKTIRFGKPVS